MNVRSVLLTLSVKGFAKPDALAEALPGDREALDALLASLLTDGKIEETKIGMRLTAEGKSEAQAAMEGERAELDPRWIDVAYERFCASNDAFKSTVMAWQMRVTNGSPAPNDHSDAAYDSGVLDRIAAIDADVAEILNALAERLPRTSTYRGRFSRALERARAGDRRFVAAPIIDSYHTVWFELHEELIRLSGRTRAGEAASGRGA